MTTGRRPAVGSFISAEWRMLGVVSIRAVVVIICFVMLSIFARCIAIAVAGPPSSSCDCAGVARCRCLLDVVLSAAASAVL